MKKKLARRFADPETRDTVSSSDNEKMKSATRSSTRKKKIFASSFRNSSVSPRMADSAYEADDSARSDSSPPKQSPQPMDNHTEVDDLTVGPKSRKRKNTSLNKQNNKSKKSNKPRHNLNMSTSTPVFENNKLRDNPDCHLVTPEVTPILPADHHDSKRDVAYVQSQDLSTPTLRRSLRKRSFSFHDPDLSAISTELSFDSQADSGIVVSPPLKKVKPSRCAIVSGGSRQPVSSKALKEDSSSKPVKPVSSPVSSKKSEKSNKVTVPRKLVNYSVKGKSVLKDSVLNSSCFGFDSIQTPSPVIRQKKSKNLRVKKATKLPQKAYRSPVKNLSDSPFDDSPGRASTDSLSMNTDSQENMLVSHPSPSLFSDDMFSDDGGQMAVNKTCRSYKSSRPKIKISKPQVSKIDAWASSFNTELESIEKFDLNIE